VRRPFSPWYNDTMKGLFRKAFLPAALLILSVFAAQALSAQTLDDLFSGLQKAFESKDPAAYLSYFSPDLRSLERANVESFWKARKMDRVLFRAASRGTLGEGESEIYVQVLFENDYSAMVEVWHLRLSRTEDRWQIQTKEVTGNVTTLYRLRLPSGHVERASLVEIRHEDIQISFQDAWVFYDNIPDLETALIVLGKGRLFFSPSSDAEKHQIELRYGNPDLEDVLDHVYLRFSPSFFKSNITVHREDPAKSPPLSQADTNRAYSLFSKYYPASFTIENSMTGELLSFLPQGDQVAFEFEGRNAGELTYIFSPFTEEEIQLVHRNPVQIINLYSPGKESRSEKRIFISFGQKFDVRRCDLDVDFQPDKVYISAHARLEISAEIDGVDSLQFGFNPDLDILRVNDPEGVELFYTQDKPRKLLYVYLLRPLAKGESRTIDVFYRGELEPPLQTTDVVSEGQYDRDISLAPIQHETYLYSQSANWYPSPSGADYFLASLRISVPPGYVCVANGVMTELSTIDSVSGVFALEKVGNSVFSFATKSPVRYLSFIVGRFSKLPNGSDSRFPDIQIFISPDVRIQRKWLLEETLSIFENYERWFGPYPYEKLAVLERPYPTTGGHSPASFVVLNELPRLPENVIAIRPESPVDLSRWKEYFLAHEVAHQWWGQAVGWDSYRDQWLSEGLAQFAAVQYLKTKYGERTWAGILKRFGQWTERKSKWGAITLGSRLSFLDFEAYQAIVYNKSTVALYLLDDLIGEDVFFKGLQEFAKTYRFRAARTSQFVKVMEQASGRSLQAFFDGWFDSYLLPDVRVTHETQRLGKEFRLTFKVVQSKASFVFPLWVEWQESGRRVRQKLEVDRGENVFEFRTKTNPGRIKINPDKFVPGNFR
jgi:hypothetical protein